MIVSKIVLRTLLRDAKVGCVGADDTQEKAMARIVVSKQFRCLGTQ